jgi:deoxyribose-phosphate aldolase
VGTAIDLGANDLRVVEVKVIELCFNSAHKALAVAGRIVEEHPAAVLKILTGSDLVNGTSVLHVHVRSELLDEFLGQRVYIKDSGGAMLVTVAEQPLGAN